MTKEALLAEKKTILEKRKELKRESEQTLNDVLDCYKRIKEIRKTRQTLQEDGGRIEQEIKDIDGRVAEIDRLLSQGEAA